jgi:hypothetical protein
VNSSSSTAPGLFAQHTILCQRNSDRASAHISGWRFCISLRPWVAYNGKRAKVLSMANRGMGVAVDIVVIREHGIDFLPISVAGRSRSLGANSSLMGLRSNIALKAYRRKLGSMNSKSPFLPLATGTIGSPRRCERGPGALDDFVRHLPWPGGSRVMRTQRIYGNAV